LRASGDAAMPQRREDFDRRLAKMVFEMKIPTLAIGAGMQTLNVICGGTLFQHVAEDVFKSLCHRDPVENCLRHVIESSGDEDGCDLRSGRNGQQ
jgi:putative glutamine amidotransferase